MVPEKEAGQACLEFAPLDEQGMTFELGDAGFASDQIEYLLVYASNCRWKKPTSSNDKTRGFGTASQVVKPKLAQKMVRFRVVRATSKTVHKTIQKPKLYVLQQKVEPQGSTGKQSLDLDTVLKKAIQFEYAGKPEKSIELLAPIKAKHDLKRPKTLDATGRKAFEQMRPKFLQKERKVEYTLSPEEETWLQLATKIYEPLARNYEEVGQFKEAASTWKNYARYDALLIRRPSGFRALYANWLKRQKLPDDIATNAVARATLLVFRASARNAGGYGDSSLQNRLCAIAEMEEAAALYKQHLKRQDIRYLGVVLKLARAQKTAGQLEKAKQTFNLAKSLYASAGFAYIGIPILCDLELAETLVANGELQAARDLIGELNAIQLPGEMRQMATTRCLNIEVAILIREAEYLKARSLINESFERYILAARSDRVAIDRSLDIIVDIAKKFGLLTQNSLTIESLDVARQSSEASLEITNHLQQLLQKIGHSPTGRHLAVMEQARFNAHLVLAARTLRRGQFSEVITQFDYFDDWKRNLISEDAQIERELLAFEAQMALGKLKEAKVNLDTMKRLASEFPARKDPVLKRVEFRIQLAQAHLLMAQNQIGPAEKLLVNLDEGDNQQALRKFGLLADCYRMRSQVADALGQKGLQFEFASKALDERARSIQSAELMATSFGELVASGRNLHVEMQRLVAATNPADETQCRQAWGQVHQVKKFLGTVARVQAEFFREASKVAPEEVTRFRGLQSEYASLKSVLTLNKSHRYKRALERMIVQNQFRQASSLAKLFAVDRLRELAQTKADSVFEVDPSAAAGLKPHEVLVDIVAAANISGDTKDPSNCYYGFVVDSDNGQIKVSLAKLGQLETVDRQIELLRNSINVVEGARGFGFGKVKGVDLTEKISEALWSPLAKLIAPAKKHVTIHHDGKTGRLAWCLLKADKKLLLEKYSFSRTDVLEDALAANELARKFLAGAPEAKAPRRGIGIGDIVYGANIPKLQASASELKSAQNALAKKLEWAPLTGLDATEPKIVEQLDGKAYDVVLLSTHGFVIGDQADTLAPFTTGFIVAQTESPVPNDPIKAKIQRIRQLPEFRLEPSTRELQPVKVDAAISEDPEPSGTAFDHDDWWIQALDYEIDKRPDGLLTFPEILAMDMSQVDLVIGSACQSADGPNVEGNGVITPTNAFHWAGARSTLSSLWNLSDEKASDVSVPFLEEFGKRFGKRKLDNQPQAGKAEILRQIQLKMHRQGVSPKYWASWVVTGGWE